MRQYLSALGLALLTALPLQAQELRSAYFMETSNYKHEMNPALLDAPYVSMPLFMGNFNLGLSSNFGASNFVYKMQPTWQGYGTDGRTLTTFMHPAVNGSEFLSGLKNRSNFSLHFKYTLAAAAFRAFGGINLVELNLRSATSLSLPKDLFAFMKEVGNQTDYNISDLGLSTQNYMELGLGHSRAINEKLTVGAKFKVLLGLAYADFEASDFRLHLSDDYWQVRGNATLSAAMMGAQFTYDDADKNYTDPNTGQLTDKQRVDGLDDFGFSMPGFGLGIDLGATYQLLPDLKLSAAITDLGFINWRNAQQARSAGEWRFDGFKEDIYINGEDKGNNKIEDQFDAIGDDLENLFAVYDEGQQTRTKALAATLNIGADYTLPVYRKLRFGFLYTSRMAGRYAHHQGMLSATVRPVKCFEASVNVAAGSAGVTYGAVIDIHAPHFNLFVGADRFPGKVSKEYIPLDNANANISLGISFPL